MEAGFHQQRPSLGIDPSKEMVFPHLPCCLRYEVSVGEVYEEIKDHQQRQLKEKRVVC